MEVQGRGHKIRTILHVDMDCFYATVEHTRLGIPLDVPLAVQQWEGLVAVNYAARAQGVKRFDTPTTAKEKCPDLVLVHVETIGCKPGSSRTSGKVSLERYRQASLQVFELFREFCPQCERASVDEAYFDVTSMVEGMMKEVTDWQARLDDLLTRLKLVEDEATKTAPEEALVDAWDQPRLSDRQTRIAEEELTDGAIDTRSLKRCKLLAEGSESSCDAKEAKEQDMGWPGLSGAGLGRRGEEGLSQDAGDIAGAEDRGQEGAGCQEVGPQASHSVGSLEEEGKGSDCLTLEGKVAEEETVVKGGENAGPVFVLEPRLRVLGGPIRLDDAAERSLLAAVVLAEKLQDTVRVRLGYTLSVGIAHNKLLAKMGSAITKPLGMTVVPHRAVAGLMRDLPIQKVRLLGGKLGEELTSLGYETAGHVEDRLSMGFLCSRFGDRLGTYVFHAVRGEDFTPVEVKAIPKSMLAAKSFNPTSSLAHIRRWVSILSQELAERMLRDACRNARSPHHFHVHYRGEGRRIGQGGDKSKSLPMPAAVTQLLMSISTRTNTAHSIVEGNEKSEDGEGDKEAEGVAEVGMMLAPPSTQMGGTSGEEFSRLWTAVGAGLCKALEEAGMKVLLGIQERWLPCSRLALSATGFEKLPAKGTRLIDQMFAGRRAQAPGGSGGSSGPAVQAVAAATGASVPEQKEASALGSGSALPSASDTVTSQRQVCRLMGAASNKEGLEKEEVGGGEGPVVDSEGVRGAQSATPLEPCQLVREGKGSSDQAQAARVPDGASSRQLDQRRLENPLRQPGARRKRGRGGPLRPNPGSKISSFFSSKVREGIREWIREGVTEGFPLSDPRAEEGRGLLVPFPQPHPAPSVLNAGGYSAGSADEMGMEEDIEDPGEGEGEENAEVQSQGLGREECSRAPEGDKTVHKEDSSRERQRKESAEAQRQGLEGRERSGAPEGERTVLEEDPEEGLAVGGRGCSEPRHSHRDLEAQGGEEEVGEVNAEQELQTPGQEASQTAEGQNEQSSCGRAASLQWPRTEIAAQEKASEHASAEEPLEGQGGGEGVSRGGWASDEGPCAPAHVSQAQGGVPQGLLLVEDSGTVPAREEGLLDAGEEVQGMQGRGESGTEGFDLGSVDVQEQARIFEAIRGRNDAPASKAGASRAHSKGPARGRGGSRNGGKGHTSSKAPAASIKGYFLPKTRG